MKRAASVLSVVIALAATLLLLALSPAPAWAETAGSAPDCPELPCSVNRNCSSTGVACDPDDRACTGKAREDNLEVKCEQQCTARRRLVYCPPDTGRSDSKIVWILLSVAVTLAFGGSGLLWLVLRKKKA